MTGNSAECGYTGLIHVRDSMCLARRAHRVHGIVHVALSMSRPLRAAMRWPTASLDTPTATRCAARTRGCRGVAASSSVTGLLNARSDRSHRRLGSCPLWGWSPVRCQNAMQGL
jgi:hypothetical protein